MGTYTALDLERFTRKIGPLLETGCLTWLGWHNGSGYACFDAGSRSDGTRRKVRAHRIMWEIARGDIPEGMQVDHLCRNRGCINPKHLEIVTSRENTLRGESPSAVAARRTACIRGHDLTGENLRIETYGGRSHRRCRTCHRDRVRASA